MSAWPFFLMILVELLLLPLLLQALFRVETLNDTFAQRKPGWVQQLKTLKKQVRSGRKALQASVPAVDAQLSALQGGAKVRWLLNSLNQWVWPKLAK